MAVLDSYERGGRAVPNRGVDPEVFITDRLPLTQYQSTIDRFAAGAGLRVRVAP